MTPGACDTLSVIRRRPSRTVDTGLLIGIERTCSTLCADRRTLPWSSSDGVVELEACGDQACVRRTIAARMCSEHCDYTWFNLDPD